MAADGQTWSDALTERLTATGTDVGTDDAKTFFPLPFNPLHCRFV